MAENPWRSILDGCQVCGECASMNRDTEPYRTRLCLIHQNQLDRILIASQEWQDFDAARQNSWTMQQLLGRGLAHGGDIAECTRSYYAATLKAHDFVAAIIANLRAEWKKEHPDNG